MLAVDGQQLGATRLDRVHEQRITRRMRLVQRDVVLPDAEGEVDGVQVLQRRRQERQVERDEQRTQDCPGQALCARHAGRSSNPSLRLPVRYPWRSIVT